MTKAIELAYKKAHEYFSDEKSEAMDHQVLKNFESDIRADERARLLAAAGEPEYKLSPDSKRPSLYDEDQVAAAVLRSQPSDERIMEVARKHWKLPGRDVIDFVRELLG